MTAANDVYGWYERSARPDQQPAYAPPHDAPCPYCGCSLADGVVFTHTFLAMQTVRRNRSYFYRTHRNCHMEASDGLKQSAFHAVLRRVMHDAVVL